MECLEPYLDAIHLQKVDSAFQSPVKRARGQTAMKNAQAGGKALRCDRRWAKGVNEAEACEITSSGSTSSQLDKQG